MSGRVTLPTYGKPERFGPLHRQAVRFIGRVLLRLGEALYEWSWRG